MVDICYKANYTGLINRQPGHWLFFWTGSHHPVDKGGDTTAKSHIRIDPEQIPKVEQKILCATVLEAVIRFYEAPERQTTFESWRMEKGGYTDGQTNRR